MLTIREVIKTFYNALLQRLKKHRGNWEQNDPTADDYIKNRPFYTDDSKKETVVKTTNFTATSSYWWGSPFVFIPVVGETYKVTWDDKEYICTCYDSDGKYIGNIYVASEGNVGTDTGEPFYYYWYDSSNYGLFVRYQGQHTITIETIKVEKLDKRYLPDLGLAPVATSGSYYDLEDTPTIYSDIVRYNISQGLSTAQKTRARANIGAVSVNETVSQGSKATSQYTISWDGTNPNTGNWFNYNAVQFWKLPNVQAYRFEQLASTNIPVTFSNGASGTYIAFKGTGCYGMGSSATQTNTDVIVITEPTGTLSLNGYSVSRKPVGVYMRYKSNYPASLTQTIYTDYSSEMPTVITGTKTSVKLNEDGTFFDEHIPDSIARTSDLATVATTGNYNDLSNLPTIPVQVQSDWNDRYDTSKAHILNRPFYEDEILSNYGDLFFTWLDSNNQLINYTYVCSYREANGSTVACYLGTNSNYSSYSSFTNTYNDSTKDYVIKYTDPLNYEYVTVHCKYYNIKYKLKNTEYAYGTFSIWGNPGLVYQYTSAPIVDSNYNLLTMEQLDNGLPFAIVLDYSSDYWQNEIGILKLNAYVHEIRTIQEYSIDLKQLDEKFIPSTIARTEDLEGFATEEYVNSIALPPVTTENNGAILQVIDGKWTAVQATTSVNEAGGLTFNIGG